MKLASQIGLGLGACLLTACGAKSLDSSDGSSGGTNASEGGSASRSLAVSVQSDRPTAGSSVGASFTTGAMLEVEASCATTTIGACTYNPCAVPPADGTTTANVGVITIAVAGTALATLDPQANGIYPQLAMSGAPAWASGGEAVTVAWANAPGDPSLSGGSASFASPPYVALSTASAFATNPGTLSRASDLTVVWTTDTPGGSADQLVVDLTTNPAQLVCEFAASAGTGTLPAAALELLGAGAATYDVHSKEFGSEGLLDGAGDKWSAGVNIDAHARTAGGLAYGPITIQ